MKLNKDWTKVQIQQIRNATIKANYNGKIFIDPWLAPKGAMGKVSIL